jgi:hypothetical protein
VAPRSLYGETKSDSFRKMSHHRHGGVGRISRRVWFLKNGDYLGWEGGRTGVHFAGGEGLVTIDFARRIYYVASGVWERVLGFSLHKARDLNS